MRRIRWLVERRLQVRERRFPRHACIFHRVRLLVPTCGIEVPLERLYRGVGAWVTIAHVSRVCKSGCKTVSGRDTKWNRPDGVGVLVAWVVHRVVWKDSGEV